MMLQIIDAQGKLVRVESTTGNIHYRKGNLRAELLLPLNR